MDDEVRVGSAKLYVGVAGWAIPRVLIDRFDNGASHLARYASRFNAVEINSSFYRSHRRSTYQRWAASVPHAFRFAVKLPKTITHERRLVGCEDLLSRFADDVSGLGGKLGPVLVQLPPSLIFDCSAVQQFFAQARNLLGGTLVCEPRHPSWNQPHARSLLAEQRITYVIADPPIVRHTSTHEGQRDTRYFRMHGSPRIYWSNYTNAEIRHHADIICTLAASDQEVWTIFDNTAAGCAPANALELIHQLA